MGGTLSDLNESELAALRSARFYVGGPFRQSLAVWLAARTYYAEQSEAFAAGQKMEWDAMKKRLEEADQRNALLLKTANAKAEELEEAEQELEQAEQRQEAREALGVAALRERALTEALLAARADILGVNTAAFESTRGEVARKAIARIDSALAAHPDTKDNAIPARDRAAAG
jgi:hypothetical protein